MKYFASHLMFENRQIWNCAQQMLMKYLWAPPRPVIHSIPLQYYFSFLFSFSQKLSKRFSMFSYIMCQLFWCGQYLLLMVFCHKYVFCPLTYLLQQELLCKNIAKIQCLQITISLSQYCSIVFVAFSLTTICRCLRFG